MRSSTVVVLLCPLSFGACATAQELSITGTSVPFGGPEADSGVDSGAGGAGSAGFPTESGGLPTGAGGIPASVNTGGQVTASGGRTAGGGGMPQGAGGGAGRQNGGGAPAGSGGANNGGSGPSGCNTGEKSCGGVCVAHAPSNGCSATACSACTNTAPNHGFLTCNAQGQCDFDCFSGFTKNGQTCGTGTGGGSGGATGGGDGGVTSCTSTDGTKTRQCDGSCNGSRWHCCQKQPLDNLAPLCICVDNVTKNLCQ